MTRAECPPSKPSPNHSLPAEGLPRDEVLRRLRELSHADADYRGGRTWSLVYDIGDEHTSFLKEAYALYFSENGLNPMAFSSLKRMESDVVRMAAPMLHGDERTVGTMTSGGTESCLLAVKTYRDWARKKWPWILRPQIVAPATIHVAFEKAASYFGVKVVHAPVGDDFRVDVRAVRRRINRNTIALVASAPCYSHGVVDPIAELGALAQRKGLPLHVDSCLGGFMLPWVEKLGRPVPPFDFRVPGVTSISADVHKYGYAAKGASVILYRDIDVLKHQFFVYPKYPGGVYASPALLGTRPGGAFAAAWAAMMAMGESGYLDRARLVMETTDRLIAGIEAIPGLAVLGNPVMSVFAYGATDKQLGIYAVGDQMEARGWHIDRTQMPEALHAMVTPRHAAVVDAYLADLRESVEVVRKNPELALTGGAATYGMISRVPLKGLIEKNVLEMMMQMYGPSGEVPDLSAGSGSGLADKLGLQFLKLRRKLDTLLP